jgi:RNA polymerase sigma factor (sigma-70 family)
MRAARDEAYDEFFAGVIGQAVKVAERVLNDRSAAEDAAVEALARAHLRWRSLRDKPYRQAWVLRVAVNAAFDARRSELRRRNRDRLGFGAASTFEFEQSSVERIVLAEALWRLPGRQREAVALRYVADLPQEEVAAAMGVSAGSIQVHIRRGLSALGRQLAHEITEGSHDVDA